MPTIPSPDSVYTTQTVPAGGPRRGERVTFQIPLQLSARLPDGHKIRVEVNALVVTAHGGLLDVGMELEPGQRIMLSHTRWSEPVKATVLRAEESDGDRYSVAFEFEFPVTSFWPVAFPSDTDLSWLE